ncbi:nitroreductase family protein [Pseudoduganella albidiflava]|uniref:Nitroreductase n=1 Tax=Pseudoduganella albidiflava TaxID=321983 RepID=A0A411WUU8_9BURK|nr:nitroreductase family protein [Pseudoduganella albidiflava]QBI00409.1 nitroreductase family protein [Pseudoduganella albidiflava]GGY53694.1 nitroreductase [Pseudoduganella albidiflava]
MTHPTLQAIAERRTTNLFDPARDIAVTQIGELVHFATRAPTSFNLQNWRFIAVHEPASKARLRKVAWDQGKITDAAVTFIVCGQLADERVLAGRLKPVVDAGIMPAAMVPGWEGAARSLYNDQPQRQRDEAIRSATLGAATLIHAAQAMGLGSAPMIGFDADAVAREFGLAAGEIPVVLVAVGYALPENWPQKPRRPLEEVLELA